MREAAQFRFEADLLSRLSIPLLLADATHVVAVSAGLRPHLPRLLAEGRTGVPGPAAVWLSEAVRSGEGVEVSAAVDKGLPALRLQVLARAEGAASAAGPAAGPAKGDGLSLCYLSGHEAGPAGRGLDSRLAGLLDSARFVAMGELVDALEHRLNQPRATLRNRLAILEAVQRQAPERVPEVLAQAYADLQSLFDALSAFRAELTEKTARAHEESHT